MLPATSQAADRGFETTPDAANPDSLLGHIEHSGHVHRGGIRVVNRLHRAHVIVWMHRRLAAKQLPGGPGAAVIFTASGSY